MGEIQQFIFGKTKWKLRENPAETLGETLGIPLEKSLERRFTSHQDGCEKTTGENSRNSEILEDSHGKSWKKSKCQHPNEFRGKNHDGIPRKMPWKIRGRNLVRYPGGASKADREFTSDGIPAAIVVI